jgi:DNA-binding beta-propeller fold protein YncE
MDSLFTLRTQWVNVISSVALAFLMLATPARADSNFWLFETGQVRPLAMSPDKKALFAINTPDNRLEIFDITHKGLKHRTSVPVGLEPVAVAARSNDEVWVVNHLSDSVSIVDISLKPYPNVVRTLLVGDEPRDIVFGGPSRERAFITTAHRGQNSPIDPALHTPGVGRADVWVFDANYLGAALVGNPLTIITLFSDTPRALAVTPDGSRVYAAAFMSGNRTTVLSANNIPDGGESAGGLPAPYASAGNVPAPEVGLIVKYNGQHWIDELGRSWDHRVRLALPDKDVFVIDANASPPAALPGAPGFRSGVGTVIFNMAVNPVSGKVYVSNTEARNERRFEGPGLLAGHSVRGQFAQSRITVIDGQSVLPRHLNKHINYDACCAPTPNPESERSLAMPLDMAVSNDGQTLYVTAFGSSKLGVFSTAALENNTFVPSPADHIELSGGGPSGVLLDEARGRLYVLTRFDNSISIVDAGARAEVGKVAMYNPEPASVVAGRPFLYDARNTSSHGDSSCASCHIFGDLDALAWDLGDPDGEELPNPGPFVALPPPPNPMFHPMKGPMTTQSLRGLANHGAMHWRGDRTGGNEEPHIQPDSGAYNEQKAFKQFNGAFEGLLGRSSHLTDQQMQQFTDFILQVAYPPNPIRALDNSLTPGQAVAKNMFFNVKATIGLFSCNDCHHTDPQGNAEFGVARPGFFGGDGRSLLGLQGVGGQSFKVPQLRNMYQKVGMFGVPEDPDFHVGTDTSFMGDSIRGFGFLHDGSIDTMLRFHSGPGFVQSPTNPDAPPVGPSGDPLRTMMSDFLFAFDSNLAPIVGQQVTLTADNASVAQPRIHLLMARANAGECDLIAKTQKGHRIAGFLYQPSSGLFLQDRLLQPKVSNAGLQAESKSFKHEITYTCVPLGSGPRMGLDRDSDGSGDGDEEAAGTDPANPASKP